MKSHLAVVLIAAVAFSGRGDPVSAQADMNREIVQRFVDAVNERDFDALDELVAPEVVRHSPSTPGVTVNSLDDLKAFLRQNLAAVPDEVQTIEMVVAEGDKVALWANYAGTQEGAMGPFPPSGRRVDTDFAAILRIEGGRIAEMWVVWDNVALLTQLGHMEPPGA